MPSHIAEPVLVLVLDELADRFGALRAQTGDRIVDVFDRAKPGFRNFVNSMRPWPSGIRIIATSTLTPSSPLRRSTQGPSTGICPSIDIPRVAKKPTAAHRAIKGGALAIASHDAAFYRAIDDRTRRWLNENL